MKFPLHQLYDINESKPLVQVDDTGEWIQWDTCDLEGLPPKRERGSMTDHGAISKGQYENLPTMFTDTNGKEHKIEDIHSLTSSK